VAPGTGGFTNSHCTTKGLGNFSTVKAPSTTKVRATNTTIITIKFNPFGIKIDIQCETLEGTGSVTNEIIEGEEQAVGKEIAVQFANCTVLEPKEGGCKVKGGGFEFSNLKAITSMIGKETGITFTPAGEGGLGKVTLEGCKTASLNNTYTVEGGLLGIVDSENPAKVNVTEASSKEGGLKIGGLSVIVIFTWHYVVAGTEKTVSTE
jgi:hypothetical protein